MKKKKVKNMKIGKKISILALSGGILVTATRCSTVPQIDMTLSETLEENGQNTYLDELLGKNLLAIEELEDDIQIISYLGRVKCGEDLDIDSLSEEEKESLRDASKKDIILLFSSYISNDKKIIKENKTLQKLAFIKKHYKQKIEKNGLPISETLLKLTIKAAACQASGLEAESCYDCIISPYVPEGDPRVIVKDPINDQSQSYQPKNIYNTMSEELYTVQMMETSGNNEFEDTLGAVKFSLNLVKASTYYGVEPNKNKIKARKSNREVMKKVKEKGKF